MILLYKDGNSFCIITDCNNKDFFAEEFSRAMDEVFDLFPEDKTFQLQGLLPLFLQLGIVIDNNPQAEKQVRRAGDTTIAINNDFLIGEAE